MTGDGTPPTDPDGDGLYEDVDGDGAFDVLDVSVLFDRFRSDAVTENPGCYDFNGNRRLDFDDLVDLVEQL